MLAIVFPGISPEIISFGPLALRWYSLAYIFGILLGWLYAQKIVEKFSLKITRKNVEDFVTWAIISIIIGGRLGYTLFYDPVKYLSQPLEIIKIYEGGMSFHGGLLGLIIGSLWFCRIYQLNFWRLTDLLAAVAPIGLFLGRIGNFINGELYGRVTDVPWGVIFPGSNLPRHPSQLYEALFEGIILFLILTYGIFKYRIIEKKCLTQAVFLILYSVFRIFIENYREPDLQTGFIWYNITMGQLLSLPMLLTGICQIIRIKCQSKSV